ncbi:hypothetical protein CEXT_460141 [Caerostris extrusa]|uniref:Uncharacterized protein n=1 Tax=Caerostris extrusa TaxID=172846 RepID=A0AAV4WFX0_CAEEX|nr:hypothetical protein CEXT_460141 [Caerostris extrusa]
MFGIDLKKIKDKKATGEKKKKVKFFSSKNQNKSKSQWREFLWKPKESLNIGTIKGRSSPPRQRADDKKKTPSSPETNKVCTQPKQFPFRGQDSLGQFSFYTICLRFYTFYRWRNRIKGFFLSRL